jgi:hypothetical protein
MGCARHTGYNVCKFLFGKRNGKRLFRRPGHRWENITNDVIGMDMKKRIVCRQGVLNSYVHVL